jgi:predicted nuclease with TOPRIM domain
MAIRDEVVFLLEENIKRLLSVANDLKDSNLQLEQQVEELSETIRIKDLEIEELASRYQNLMLAKTITLTAEDVKKVKLRINEMVRDIDKCIALMNK